MKTQPLHLILCVLLALCGLSSGAETLKSIEALRALNPVQAANAIPVRIDAQVMRIHMNNGLFIYNGTRGIFVQTATMQDSNLQIKEGTARSSMSSKSRLKATAIRRLSTSTSRAPPSRCTLRTSVKN